MVIVHHDDEGRRLKLLGSEVWSGHDGGIAS